MENTPAACWGEWNQLISCVSSSPEWGPSSPAPGHGFLHPEPAARNLIQFKGEELVRGSEPGSCPRRDPLGAGAGFASCLLRSRPPPPPSAPNGGGGHSEPCAGGIPPQAAPCWGFPPKGFFLGGLFPLHPTTAASLPGASILAQAVTGLGADALGSIGKTWVESPPRKPFMGRSGDGVWLMSWGHLLVPTRRLLGAGLHPLPPQQAGNAIPYHLLS